MSIKLQEHNFLWPYFQKDCCFVFIGLFLIPACVPLSAGPVLEQVETALTKRPMSNTRRVADRNLGPMLPATRNLLREFHQPFNQKLAGVLDNNAFLWSNSWRAICDWMWMNKRKKLNRACLMELICSGSGTVYIYIWNYGVYEVDEFYLWYLFSFTGMWLIYQVNIIKGTQFVSMWCFNNVEKTRSCCWITKAQNQRLLTTRIL